MREGVKPLADPSRWLGARGWAKTEIRLVAHSAIRNCHGSFPEFILGWTIGARVVPTRSRWRAVDVGNSAKL